MSVSEETADVYKDGLEVTTASGVWCVVSYDYYANIASVHPTKTAAMAARKGRQRVGFLPFGKGGSYFGMEYDKMHLEAE